MSKLAAFAPLRTERLDLVALRLEDAPAVFAYASDPEISRLMDGQRCETLADARRYVARSMIGYSQGGHYEWGLVMRASRDLMGACGLSAIDPGNGIGDLHYVLAKPFWGQGYATEAALAVLEFGFLQLGLRLIEAHAFPENSASLRVLAKLGLRHRETISMSQESGASRLLCSWQIERERWLAGCRRNRGQCYANSSL